MQDAKFFRPTALAARWGMSASSVRRLAALGKLPKPIRLSERIYGWSLATVEKIEKSRDKAAR